MEVTAYHITRFLDALQKIDRAQHHIQGAHAIMAEYCRDAFALQVERDASSGVSTLSFSAEPIPVTLALTIGDAIHNLSSALDSMVSQLMTETTGKLSQRTTFPMHDSLDQLQRAFMEGGERQCGCGKGKVRERNGPAYPIHVHAPKLEELILDTFKPCATEQSILYAIRKADNWDKHNTMLIMIGGLYVMDVNFETTEGNVYEDNTLYVHMGQKLEVEATRGDFDFKSKGRTVADLVFGPGTPLEGFRVFHWLGHAHQSVGNVLIEMERTFGDLRQPDVSTK